MTFWSSAAIGIDMLQQHVILMAFSVAPLGLLGNDD